MKNFFFKIIKNYGDDAVNFLQPKRTQAYYDELAKCWNNGVSYYNPRTNKTLYTSAKTTHIFDGQLPTNGPLNNYSEIGSAREQLKMFHDVGSNNNLVVWNRKPNNQGIMNFLTKANSTETRFYRGAQGLYTS